MDQLFNLLDDKLKSHWNGKLETLLEEIETSITKSLTLRLSSVSHPIFVNVNFPLFGIGYVLFSSNEKKTG